MSDLAVRRLAKFGVAVVMATALWVDGLHGSGAVGGASHVNSVVH